MAFECPRRSSPPSPMFDADTGCIATDPAPSARRRFRSKTGIENLPANEHAQETPHTPSPTRTTRRIQSGCAGSRPRLRDGMPGSPSQHIDITRAKWIPYFQNTPTARLVRAAIRLSTYGLTARNGMRTTSGTRQISHPIATESAGSSCCPQEKTPATATWPMSKRSSTMQSRTFLPSHCRISPMKINRDSGDCKRGPACLCR